MHVRRALWALGMMVAVLAGCTPPPVTAGIPIGRIERPGVTQVPLPPGDWTEMLRDSDSAYFSFFWGMSNNRATGVAFVRLVSGRVQRLLLVSTNTTSTGGEGYTPPAYCTGPDPNPSTLYFSDVKGGSRFDLDCLKVRLLDTGPKFFDHAPLTRRLRDALLPYGGVPAYAVGTQFITTIAGNYMIYASYVFPLREGVTGRAWKAGQLGRGEKALVDGVVAWAKAFRPAIVAGTMGRL